METFDNVLKRINSLLTINGKCIKDPSLAHGLCGLSIYFYTLHKIDPQRDYFTLAEYFSDKIVPIQPNIAFDFFKGLAGICVSVDYLVHNRLLDIDPDQILLEMDNAFFYRVACADSSNLENLWSLGKYLQARHRFAEEKKKDRYYEFLIHLTDKFKTFYTENLSDTYIFQPIDLKVLITLEYCEAHKINIYEVSSILKKMIMSLVSIRPTK